MTDYDPIDNPDRYLQDCVRIDDQDLQAEFVRLPADLAFWNNQYAQVYQYWLQCKSVSDQVVANVSLQIRNRMLTEPRGGRVTVSEVEQACHLDPAYQQAKAKEHAAEAEKVRLYGILDALRTKREMLISLGAHQRAEMARDPLIREQRALEHEVARAKAGINSP